MEPSPTAPTHAGKSKSALNAVKHGLTSNALVLSTESREKMDELRQAYRDEYQPQGQTETDLVDELTAAKWLQRRCWAMQSALLDTTMDRMEREIRDEFAEIGNAARTALAFLKLTDQGTALALMNRYAARHARDYHRALDKLRLIQKERRQAAIPDPGPDPSEFPAPNEPEREQPAHIEPLAAAAPFQAPQPPVTYVTDSLPSAPRPLVSCDFIHLAVPTAVFPKSL